MAAASPSVFTRVPRAWRGWVLPLALVLLWGAAIGFGWSTSPLLVSPLKVAATGWQQIASGKLAMALQASLVRDLAGLALGAGAGLLFGGALGLSRAFERALGPSFHTLKQISLFAWVPLLSAWFGLGEGAKIAFVSMAAFFPVVLNTFEACAACRASSWKSRASTASAAGSCCAAWCCQPHRPPSSPACTWR